MVWYIQYENVFNCSHHRQIMILISTSRKFARMGMGGGGGTSKYIRAILKTIKNNKKEKIHAICTKCMRKREREGELVNFIIIIIIIIFFFLPHYNGCNY
jgi:ribosomal protein L44E